MYKHSSYSPNTVVLNEKLYGSERDAAKLYYDDIAMDVEKNRETINNINSFFSVERSENTAE